ncbi:hypothetical protein [Phyllobacterium zundukense]|uniref:hypothetical protein n=1 Tax=Phyllobacterium zundukense TaxID=1867719 RepID=UPI0012FFF6DD|nr:hypothetical protein [Phyllobacterium zundukense]
MENDATAADDSARDETANYLRRKAEFEAASAAGFEEGNRLLEEYIAKRNAK